MRALGVADYERETLGVNYRCPPKVVRVAKRLVSSTALTALAPAVPVDRETLFLEFLNEAQIGLWLVGELREIQSRDPRSSAAVICRAPATAKRLTRLMRHALDARLVLDGAFAYESGVNVTTVDHVKGLEFDYVIVPDASKTNYPNQPAARRALYVAVTRSRHELALGTVTERTPLLPSTDD
jgi:DNA helicase IV